MGKILNLFGLMKIQDHNDSLTKIQEQVDDRDKKFISLTLSKGQLQKEIDKLFESNDLLKTDNESKDKTIDDLKAHNLELTIKVARQKKVINDHLVTKHKLTKENLDFRGKINDLNQEKNSLTKSLNCIKGGYVRELNKIKSQYRFALSIIFKDNPKEKETEIFLTNEYKKLQQWDDERKKSKDE